MRTLLTFTKLGNMRLLSHLDVTRLFRRAIKRAKIDICYTEGFNPQQKITVTSPLPLGYESTAEIMMIETHDSIGEEERARLNAQLPEGIQVVSFTDMEDGDDIHTDFRFSTFEVRGLGDACSDYAEAIRSIAALPEYILTKEIVKKRKKRVQKKDIAPLIGEAICEGDVLQVTLGSFDIETLRPLDLIQHIAERDQLRPPQPLFYRRVRQQKTRDR